MISINRIQRHRMGRALLLGFNCSAANYSIAMQMIKS